APIRAQRRILHHVVPPGLLDIALEFDAERAIVPESVDPPVDLARLKDESASPAKRDQLVHIHWGSPSGKSRKNIQHPTLNVQPSNATDQFLGDWTLGVGCSSFSSCMTSRAM